MTADSVLRLIVMPTSGGYSCRLAGAVAAPQTVPDIPSPELAVAAALVRAAPAIARATVSGVRVERGGGPDGDVVGYLPIDLSLGAEMTPADLATLRKGLGLGQVAFGQLLGKSSRQVSDYERGVAPISRETALACSALARGIRGYEP